MIMRALTLAGALALALTGVAASAADQPRPLTWSEAAASLDAVATRSYEALDLVTLAEEDLFNEAAGKPPRFAVANDVAITPLSGGTWEERGATSLWRLRVTGKETASFNFGFTRFRLPDEARLFIYAADRSVSAGPYTSFHNNDAEQLWTPIIDRADVVIELEVPTARKGQVLLELTKINQGYRGFGTAVKGYAQPDLETNGEGKACKNEGGTRSGSCNTDVTCLSEGDPWNLPRRSVGAYSRSGVDACTGSLVNNTANDRRMLFMTATHCGVTTSSAPSMVVYWNYESPTCRRPGSAASGVVVTRDPNITNTGATFLAATINPFTGGGCTNGTQCSDNTIVQLNQPANPAFNLYWAGWDRRDVASICSAPGDITQTTGLCASIHHPGVDEKRITFIEQNMVSGSIAASTGVHWRVMWDPTPPNLPAFPAGGALPPSVTEGGSSGSPLYNASQRLVGVLSGGASFCGATGSSLSDEYGKIAHAWEGLGTPTTRLKDYLDPVGGAPDFIDGIGSSAFRLAANPTSVGVCATAGSTTVSIDATADAGFTTPIALAITGAPTGSTAAVAPNPLTPPGSATLTVSGLGAATAGNYNVVVTGTAGGDTFPVTIPFGLSSSSPGAASPTAPGNGDLGVGFTPTLTWAAGAGGAANSYRLEIATDAGFTAVVLDQVVTGTSYTLTTPLTGNTTYYWRVGATNYCGAAPTSAVYSFKTVAAPGQCADGQTQLSVFADNVDGGVNGWTTTGSTGASTWTRSTARPNSGTHSWFAPNIATVSDQRLISPAIALPTGQQPLTLSFQNWRQIEQSGATACWDGGVLEVSTDGGTSFTPVPGASIIGGGAYRGAISGQYGNPLAGLSGWCDDPARPYTTGPVLVDLGAYAGQTINLRFRLGTDSSVSKEGWYVDDINVTSCAVLADPIFADGFEGTP